MSALARIAALDGFHDVVWYCVWAATGCLVKKQSLPWEKMWDELELTRGDAPQSKRGFEAYEKLLPDVALEIPRFLTRIAGKAKPTDR